MAGLVRDVLQALGMDSTLRVFEPESSTEPLARANLKVRLMFFYKRVFTHAIYACTGRTTISVAQHTSAGACPLHSFISR